MQPGLIGVKTADKQTSKQTHKRTNEHKLYALYVCFYVRRAKGSPLCDKCPMTHPLEKVGTP